MALHGEGFLLFNVLTDGLVVASALRFLGVRVRTVRVVLASLIGGVYALVSLMVEPSASLVGLLMGAACMSAVTFPPGRILPGTGAVLLIALCGSGTAQVLSPLGDIPSMLGAVMFMLSFGCMSKRKQTANRCVAAVEMGGEKVFLPALVDTGNVLRDPESGLYVLVVPRAMVPQRVQMQSSTHPIPAVTASGRVTLEGMEPSTCSLAFAGRSYFCCVVVALCDAPLPLALFPAGAVLQPDEKKEVQHATGRRRSAGMADGASLRAEKRDGGVYRRCGTAAPAADGRGGKGTGDEACRG